MSLSPNPKPLIPKRSTPNIIDLRAAFESPKQQNDQSQKHPHAIYPPKAYHSNAGDLTPTANVSSNRISSLPKSIDAVLDTPASRSASPPNRPQANFRPSWIGPQPSKPNKTDVAGHMETVNKQRVSIDFASPGLKPPVYIFTSLSDPQWTVLEMFPATQSNGDFTFVRNFNVEEGEYQYKFRLGPGDWWVCDERREVVDDGTGNRNNRIFVKGGKTNAVDSGHASPEEEEEEVVATKPILSGSMPDGPTSAEAVTTQPRKSRALDPAEVALAALASAKDPSMQQEAQVADLNTESVPPAPIKVTEVSTLASQMPLAQQSQHAEGRERSSNVPKIIDSPQGEDDFEAELESYAAPLLRHESLSITSHEQEHAPLFRHESNGLGCNNHEDATLHPAEALTGLSAVPTEPNPLDTSLHPFPTDQKGILEHIQRTHTRLPADETSDDVNSASPASSGAITDCSSLSAVPSLPCVNEDEEELEETRDASEQEAEMERESGKELDPLTNEKEANEPEDDDFEPNIPELKVLVAPKVQETVDENMVIDCKSLLTEKLGAGNMMAIAVGFLAVIAAAAAVRLFR